MKGKRSELTLPPPLESYCSVSPPGETRGVTLSFEVILFDPQVNLVDASPSLEVGLPSGLEVPNTSGMRCIVNPVSVVARLAHRNQWPTYLNDLVEDLRVPTFIRLYNQLMLAHVRHSEPARGDVVLSPPGPGRFFDRDPGRNGWWCDTLGRS